MPRKVADEVARQPADLEALSVSWQLDLRARNKSAKTVTSYRDGVKAFLRWCEATGTPPELSTVNLQSFMASLLGDGAEPTTVRARYAALKGFTGWLLAEGEITSNPFVGMSPPKLDTKVVNPLTEAELRDLVKVCRGRDFRSRRDEALIRLMAETGLRAGEVIALRMPDVDLPRGLATVTRGKGGKGRFVPFGPETAAAVDRYLRIRKIHKLANTETLWLGERGGVLSYAGLYKVLTTRATMAGITGMHPHRLRHTAATRWLAKGGSEGGLMAVAGWSKREMLDRYTAATASDRAADEARRLKLGDL